MIGNPTQSAIHDCAQGAHLYALIQADHLDAAIEAGLMEYLPCPGCDGNESTVLVRMQQQLTRQWAARDRYLARQARLTRRGAELESRRVPTVSAQTQSNLPPAAAAILARAKAKAVRGAGET